VSILNLWAQLPQDTTVGDPLASSQRRARLVVSVSTGSECDCMMEYLNDLRVLRRLAALPRTVDIWSLYPIIRCWY